MEITELSLGESSQVVHVERVAEVRDYALALAQQAKSNLNILSYDLDHLVYDRPSFIEAVRGIVAGNRQASVKILIMDSSKIIQQGHRLVELARRVSSYVSIRKLNNDATNLMDAYLIADEIGLVYRRHAPRYEGFTNFNDRGQCRKLLNIFNNAWEKSLPDPELRRLYL